MMGLAQLELGAGRPEAALQTLLTCRDTLSRVGIRDPDLAPAPDLVDAHLRLGHQAEARAAAAGYDELAAAKGQPFALARAARVRGLLAPDTDFAREFETALRHHGGTPDTFERARTQLYYGERLRRARRRVEARAQLRAAMAAFDRLGAANLLSWFAPTAIARRSFINFLEDVGNHRGCGRAAVNFAADVAFVNCGKRILRLFRGQKSGEPCRRAFFVFRAPLRGPGFSGNFDAIKLRFMSGAVRAVDHFNHSRANFLYRFRGNTERAFFAQLIRRDDFVIERLHLAHEPRLIKSAAVRDDGHGLRHLQRRDLDVALTDRQVRDVTVE